jgi:hypothetical protein
VYCNYSCGGPKLQTQGWKISPELPRWMMGEAPAGPGFPKQGDRTSFCLPHAHSTYLDVYTPLGEQSRVGHCPTRRCLAGGWLNCGTSTPWNATQQGKGASYGCIQQLGWVSRALCWV